MDASFLTFLGVSILVIVTPGPDTALTIRNSLRGGRLGGIGTALGVSTGQLIWAVATSVGLVAVLLASARLSSGAACGRVVLDLARPAVTAGGPLDARLAPAR